MKKRKMCFLKGVRIDGEGSRGGGIRTCLPKKGNLGAFVAPLPRAEEHVEGRLIFSSLDGDRAEVSDIPKK
jgi:hypothetical protein